MLFHESNIPKCKMPCIWVARGVVRAWNMDCKRGGAGGGAGFSVFSTVRFHNPNCRCYLPVPAAVTPRWNNTGPYRMGAGPDTTPESAPDETRAPVRHNYTVQSVTGTIQGEAHRG